MSAKYYCILKFLMVKLPIVMQLKQLIFSTPLGDMLAVANDDYLFLLEFTDNENLEKDIQQVTSSLGAEIEEGENLPLKQIRAEIEDYFRHPFATFKTPIQFIGTDFQKEVWQEVSNIGSGLTATYSEIAERINNPNAIRAVGNALNANKLSIIVPCHRVLTKDLDFGGYNGGQARKSWLLQHEGL